MTTYTELRHQAESPLDKIEMHEGLLRRPSAQDDVLDVTDCGCGSSASPHVSHLFS